MTAYNGGNPADQSDSIPVIAMDERAANEAYARYTALRVAVRDDPSLAEEECFQILVTDAWAAFNQAFERLCA